jgi:hypothetical protein
MQPDPVDEALKKIGVRLEKKPDVKPVTQMIASGVGGIGGHLLGGFFGLGTVGKMAVSLLGSVAGHVAVTYDVHLEPRKDAGPQGEPVGPAEFSDRR